MARPTLQTAMAFLREHLLGMAVAIIASGLFGIYQYKFHPDPSIQKALDSVVIVYAGPAMGSGFFINDSGCLMTAAHVVLPNNPGSVTPISIRTHGSLKSTPARIVAVSEFMDMAVVCAEIKSPSYLRIVYTENIGRGDRVYAIGHTDGRTWNVTEGVVSRSGYKAHFRKDKKTSQVWWIPRYDLWVTTFISWGNSGGPIIDSHGNVVGMIVEWDDPVSAGHPNSMNIAIPGTDLIRFIKSAGG